MEVVVQAHFLPVAEDRIGTMNSFSSLLLYVDQTHKGGVLGTIDRPFHIIWARLRIFEFLTQLLAARFARPASSQQKNKSYRNTTNNDRRSTEIFKSTICHFCVS